MANRLALIIANSEYEDAVFTQLTTPGLDAEALAQVLSNSAIGNFEVQVLLNRPSYDVGQEIESFFANRQRDDLLLLYFSGHGVKDEDGQLYFGTCNTRRHLLRSTAVPATLVNDVMRRSRSRWQVLLLDCCYSGAFARGLLAKSDLHMDVKEHFAGRGRVVLTASDAMQYAFEGNAIKGEGVRSVFTHAMIRGLETGEADRDGNGYVTLDELYDYVFDRVTDETPQQTPGKWAFDVQGEIIIARNPHVAPVTATLKGRANSVIPPRPARQPDVPAKTPVWVALLAALGLGLGWGIGSGSLLWAISFLFNAQSLLSSNSGVLGPMVAIVIGVLAGLLTGRYLRRMRLGFRWLLAPPSWAAGYAVACLALVRFQWGDWLGAGIGALVMSGLLFEAADLGRLRRGVVNLFRGRQWIYGRLLVLILLTSGFFGPWVQLRSCQSTESSASAGTAVEPQPGSPLNGVDLLLLMFFYTAPVAAPFLLLWFATLLKLCIRRARQNEVLRWLERIGALATPIAMAALVVDSREMIASLLWGFYVTVTGILLAPLNLLGEWLSARNRPG
jgi:hypothetical protein